MTPRQKKLLPLHVDTLRITRTATLVLVDDQIFRTMLTNTCKLYSDWIDRL